MSKIKVTDRKIRKLYWKEIKKQARENLDSADKMMIKKYKRAFYISLAVNIILSVVFILLRVK